MFSDRFLDLNDIPRVVDFLVESAPYLDDKERQTAEEWIRRYHAGEKMTREKLAGIAKKVASAAWPARYAVRYYLTREVPEEEWRMIIAAVRPSTAHLMQRFRKGSGAKTLDEMLRHADVSSALREAEMAEISHVRATIRDHVWKERKAALATLVRTGEKELTGYEKRLKKMRALAGDLPTLLEDEVYSKIAHYEDRILFEGEIVPLEIMDEEVKYYTEQKEISPLET